MKEVFATVDDAMLVLGLTDEASADTQSADGRPRTKEMALNRIARMIGLDRRVVSSEMSLDLARQIIDAARKTIAQPLTHLDQGGTMVLGGHGHDLLEVSVDRAVVRLDQRYGKEASRCFPAYATAWLLSDE